MRSILDFIRNVLEFIWETVIPIICIIGFIVGVVLNVRSCNKDREESKVREWRKEREMQDRINGEMAETERKMYRDKVVSWEIDYNEVNRMVKEMGVDSLKSILSEMEKKKVRDSLDFTGIDLNTEYVMLCNGGKRCFAPYWYYYVDKRYTPVQKRDVRYLHVRIKDGKTVRVIVDEDGKGLNRDLRIKDMKRRDMTTVVIKTEYGYIELVTYREEPSCRVVFSECEIYADGI